MKAKVAASDVLILRRVSSEVRTRMDETPAPPSSATMTAGTLKSGSRFTDECACGGALGTLAALRRAVAATEKRRALALREPLAGIVARDAVTSPPLRL